MRKAELKRKTTETEVLVFLNIDGEGAYDIETGCGFLDHMLTLFARHGSFDLKVKCVGDTDVDYHHTVEDIGIVLGQCFDEALGNCLGINRYGYFILPMDEALTMVSLDISGRGGFFESLDIKGSRVGDFDTELVNEFFSSFCRASKITLHIRSFAGTNIHHIIESVFKGFARALKHAVAIDEKSPNSIPSTKGTIREK